MKRTLDQAKMTSLKDKFYGQPVEAPKKEVISKKKNNMEDTTTFNNVTASAAIKTGEGVVVGMYVNSTNAGTVKLYDNTAASGTVINNTITPAIGYHDLGKAAFATGLYAEIGGTALDVTFYYQ